MKTVRFDYCKGETARAYTVSGLHDGEDLSGEYVRAEDVQRLAAESRATVLQLEYLRDERVRGVSYELLCRRADGTYTSKVGGET
jgi:hypothetical protein